MMPPESTEPIDLLDLKLLPAWVKESPDAKEYEHFEGETEERRRPGERDRHPGDRPRRPSSKPRRTPNDDRRGPRPNRGERDRRPPRAQDRQRQDRQVAPPRPPLEVAARFVPHPPAFESVVAQIKADMLAYSLFSLARLFLQKPERYDVHLVAKPDHPLFQLGEDGAIAADRTFLENSAFRFAQNDFYKIDITQSEPIKGNFTSVARDRLSGTLLGPTNHHAYQPRLRNLYEQRFSRRMSFSDYQRQIEIATDPALVEQWKEEARTVTTFTTLREETPVVFNSAADAEKHFRQTYLPSLVRQVEETIIDGVSSRALTDRNLNRAVEGAWAAQNRSPSQMMAELSNRFRESGLQVFRHRKGMLFVTPVRVRTFAHDEAGVSAQVRAILETVGANPRINRKDLAEKLLVDLASEEVEARKMALASDLRWLISEGYVIEFNDNSLDLPRAKVKPREKAENEPEKAPNEPPPLEDRPEEAEVAAPAISSEAEIGGS